jgi:integrase
LLAYKQAILGANKLAKKLGYKAFECESPEVKRNKHRLRYLTIEEEARLLNELDPRLKRKGLADPGERSESYVRMLQDNYDFVVLLLDTGARLNEIAKLQWKYVDLDKGVIHLWRPKVQNESIIKLSERAWSIMNRRVENKLNDYVFTNRYGTTAKVSVMSIRKAIDRAGLEGVTVHTFRHSFASRLIQNGASLYEVKEMLGHSSINTTMVYAHLCQDQTTTKAKEIMDKTSKEVQKLRLKVVG